MKIYDVITRHSFLTVSAETSEQALLKVHISPGENAFVRERDDSAGFIVSLVAYAVKRFGVLIAFSQLCRNILESERWLREKLKEDTTNTGFGSEHLLYGLVSMGDETTQKFFRERGITEEELLTGMGFTCFYKAEEERLLLDNFIETISCSGVYLDSRSIFLSVCKAGTNAANILRFLGVNPEKLVREYIDFCGISKYFLTNNHLIDTRNDTCLDGIDIYKYVKDQSGRQSRITLHLRECDGLCLRTAAFVETCCELIEADGNAPALW